MGMIAGLGRWRWPALVGVAVGSAALAWLAHWLPPCPAWTRQVETTQKVLGLFGSPPTLVLHDQEDNRKLMKLDPKTGTIIGRTVLDLPGRPIGDRPFHELTRQIRISNDGARVVIVRFMAGEEGYLAGDGIETFDFESGLKVGGWRPELRIGEQCGINLSAEGTYAAIDLMRSVFREDRKYDVSSGNELRVVETGELLRRHVQLDRSSLSETEFRLLLNDRTAYEHVTLLPLERYAWLDKCGPLPIDRSLGKRCLINLQDRTLQETRYAWWYAGMPNGEGLVLTNETTPKDGDGDKNGYETKQYLCRLPHLERLREVKFPATLKLGGRPLITNAQVMWLSAVDDPQPWSPPWWLRLLREQGIGKDLDNAYMDRGLVLCDEAGARLHTVTTHKRGNPQVWGDLVLTRQSAPGGGELLEGWSLWHPRTDWSRAGLWAALLGLASAAGTRFLAAAWRWVRPAPTAPASSPLPKVP